MGHTLSLVPRFVCKNNGVLFENQLLQIGLKSEFRQNLGMCLTEWKRLLEVTGRRYFLIRYLIRV